MLPTQPLRAILLCAARRARMRCVERTERRLNGRPWPDWHTDLYVWERLGEEEEWPGGEEGSADGSAGERGGRGSALELGVLGMCDGEEGALG